MRGLRILTLACGLLLLASCRSLGGGGAAAIAVDPLQEIISSGSLRIALSGDQPPFNMRGRDGELMGLDVDLADALASAMGLEAEFVTLPFAELLPALESTRVDIVISAITITPERNARVPFAGPYYVSGTAALSKLDALAHVEDMAALDDAKRRYAAVAGTTNESFGDRAFRPHFRRTFE